ncbi:MAG: hypothetical protein LBE25_06185 [Arthrobacter sp.]|jgi:hypothetical protein|nr:hypothetical protein [Arthrobacter sp.]
MKSTHRLAAAIAVAALTGTVAACSASSAPGFDGTEGTSSARSSQGIPCGDIDGALDPSPQASTQASPQPAVDVNCAPPPSPTVVTPAPNPVPAPEPTTEPAPTTPATTPVPNSSSATPAPTTKARAYGSLLTDDKNHYIDSRVPFVAGVLTPERTTYAAYAFERMDVDFTCTNPDALPPENGHFVRVFYFLGNSKADKTTGPTLDVTEKTWGYLDADGKPWLGTLATEAAKKCLKGDDETWGATAKPGWISGGELIFDLPSTSGTLQHTWQDGVGGWRFPVENANTSFRSLDERIAEMWK